MIISERQCGANPVSEVGNSVDILWTILSKTGSQWSLRKIGFHVSHVPSVIGTVTSELVFTATTDTAQWVQIYGLLRPTDANEFLFHYSVLQFVLPVIGK